MYVLHTWCTNAAHMQNSRSRKRLCACVSILIFSCFLGFLSQLRIYTSRYYTIKANLYIYVFFSFSPKAIILVNKCTYVSLLRSYHLHVVCLQCARPYESGRIDIALAIYWVSFSHRFILPCAHNRFLNAGYYIL